MHPADIKAAIEKAGSSLIEIATGLGVSGMAVSHVVHGRATSRRVAEAIGAKIGKQPDAIWPGRYSHNFGKRKGRK